MRLREYAGTAREALGMVEDLTALAMAEMRQELRSRMKYLAGLAIAAVLGFIAVLYLGIVALVFAWDTEYRTATAIAVLLLPLAAAVAIAFLVLRQWRNDRWLSVTRAESREFYQWLKSKL